MTASLFGARFRAQAEATPDAIAIDAPGTRLTYAALATRALDLAERLRAEGVAPDVLVGVCAGRSPDLIAGVLGVTLAGGAWLPLDPEHPPQRLEYLLSDAGVRAVVAASDVAGRLPAAGPPLLDVDGPAAGRRPPGPAAAPLPEHLAYAIYTSGTTGRPKAALLRQRGLANLAEAVARTFAAGPGKRVLQVAPFSFDASVFELAMALGTGATLVLPAPGPIPLGPELAELLAERRITHVTLAPSVLATLPDAALPALEVLVCAGESLPTPVADRWAGRLRLCNAYGPTESTVWTTLAEVRPGAGRPPIGRPVAGVRTVVLDAGLGVAAPGAAGELAVGGAGLARGYLGRPGLTAERFVPDPVSGEPGARLYRSGDLVRLRPDGDLEFLGRLDDQVELRGVRVEPAEVAAVLGEHPAVRDAVVVARSDALVAYTVAPGADPVELRAHLARLLPSPMVPSAVVILPAMPLTPSGKVDRAALPAPDRASAGLSSEPSAPATAAEADVGRIVRELLGVAAAGADDDFFALGGHSLLAGRLAARVRAELGWELPVELIFEARTVRAIAALAGRRPSRPALPPVVRRSDTGPAPLSYQQEGVWFVDRMAPDGLAYHAQATVRLRGPLDRAALHRALREIVRRHEILRTRFRAVDGAPVQEPLPAVEIELPLMDVSALPAPERADRAEQVVAGALRTPFDLAAPPLVRWTLVRVAAADHLLVIVEHHLVHDGWSFALVLRELRALYAAFHAGLPSPLPEPPVQYADYVAWQRRWLTGPELRRQVDAWAARLAGSPAALALPADRPRPPTQSFRGGASRVELDAAFARRLRRFAADRGMTLFTVMLAGFAALLGRYSGQADVVIGSGFANRRHPPLETMPGMVVNTLPLRIDLGGRPAFEDLVRRVHEVVVQAHAAQDVPLSALVERLAPPRDASRSPLFQAMFSFHDTPLPDFDVAGLRATVLERHNGSAKSDLNVIAIPRGESITLIWEHAADLFRDDTMRRMVERYRALLAAALDQPGREAGRLPAFAPGELQRTTVEWNRDQRGRPGDRTVHELFEAQASSRPDAVAIAGGGRSVTYRELDGRAERLAASLRARGTGRGGRVAVLLPRGVSWVVAALAALKAGAAYVPLNPDQPPDRLRELIAAAGASAAVAEPALRDRLRWTVPFLTPDAAAAGPRDPSRTPAGPRDLAYIAFTSGSTGRPRGVMVEHRSVVRLVHGAGYLRFGPDERIAHLADPSFDATTFEVWGALLHGGTVCVIPPDVVLSPARLDDALGRAGVTTAFLTTALFNELVANRPGALAGLRSVLFGGEACDPASVRRLLRGDPPDRLVHVYGPTEATTFASWHLVGDVPEDATGVPIGRGIGGTPLYVLDAHLEPVPVDVPGELFVGGPGVARGYTGPSGLTAERFVPDPFAAEPGQRLYRTGDVVRWRVEGALEFLGRRDEQVKIRGFRVEPAETRAALTAHPAVRQAEVVAASEGGDRHLVAYLVAEPGAPRPAPAGLREFLGGRLPAYLVPAAYVFLDVLPLTPHGKLDRGALPAPAEGRPSAGDGSVPPRTPVERCVARHVADVLGLDSVGVHDDFFDLGGHSLLVAALLSRIAESEGADVPVTRFLRDPTVAGLAAAVEEAAG